VDLSIYPHHYE